MHCVYVPPSVRPDLPEHRGLGEHAHPSGPGRGGRGPEGQDLPDQERPPEREGEDGGAN